MLKVKLQINRNMATRHPDKPQDEKYRLIVERTERNMASFYYFTREELYAFADEVVNLVARLPQLEDDASLMGLEANIMPPPPKPKVTTTDLVKGVPADLVKATKPRAK